MERNVFQIRYQTIVVYSKNKNMNKRRIRMFDFFNFYKKLTFIFQ
jgi:hypothetical protein